MNENAIQVKPQAVALLELPEALRPAAAEAFATLTGILQVEDDAEVRAGVLDHFRLMFVRSLREAGYAEAEAHKLAFRSLELVAAHANTLAGRSIGGRALSS